MELGKEYRYESARRYYVARLSVDLLGDHVIDIAAGGLFNRLGRCWTLPVSTLEDGIAALVKIAHVRQLRRYRLVLYTDFAEQNKADYNSAHSGAPIK